MWQKEIPHVSVRNSVHNLNVKALPLCSKRIYHLLSTPAAPLIINFKRERGRGEYFFFYYTTYSFAAKKKKIHVG